MRESEIDSHTCYAGYRSFERLLCFVSGEDGRAVSAGKDQGRRVRGYVSRMRTNQTRRTEAPGVFVFVEWFRENGDADFIALISLYLSSGYGRMQVSLTNEVRSIPKVILTPDS